MPLDINIHDKYKFAVKVLLNNTFSVQSSEVFEKIRYSYTVLEKKDVKKHNMAGVKLESFLLNKQNGKLSVKQRGNSVIDYIWLQISVQYGFKRCTNVKLKEEILRFVYEPKTRISTYDIINWAKLHPHVSVHAFDGRYKKFISHNTPHRTRISICYIVKDYHLYPIFNKDLKRPHMKQTMAAPKTG